MRKLLDGDHGFVCMALASDSRPTRVNNLATRCFVIVAPRPSWKMALYEFVDDELVKIGELPGQKQASASMLIEIDAIRVVYASREPGDFIGLYHLWEHVFDVPGVWPVDAGAMARNRSLASVLRVQIPSLAVPLAPFMS